MVCARSARADLRLQGKWEQANYTASSSGDIDAGNMEARHVDANASSAGDISCHASESLNAHTSGGGSIAYSGNPVQVSASGKNIQKR